MKVEDLIKELETLPKDMLVLIFNCYDDMLVNLKSVKIIDWDKRKAVLLDVDKTSNEVQRCSHGKF